MSASDVTDAHQRLVQRPSGLTGSVAQHSHLPSAITPVIERMLQVCCSEGASGGGAQRYFWAHRMSRSVCSVAMARQLSGQIVYVAHGNAYRGQHDVTECWTYHVARLHV